MLLLSTMSVSFQPCHVLSLSVSLFHSHCHWHFTHSFASIHSTACTCNVCLKSEQREYQCGNHVNASKDVSGSTSEPWVQFTQPSTPLHTLLESSRRPVGSLQPMMKLCWSAWNSRRHLVICLCSPWLMKSQFSQFPVASASAHISALSPTLLCSHTLLCASPDCFPMLWADGSPVCARPFLCVSPGPLV